MEENTDLEARELDQIENEDAEFAESLEKSMPKERVVLTMKDLSELGHEVQRQKRLELAQRATEIKRLAFDQKNINLIDPIPLERMQLMIDLLSRDRKNVIDKCYDFIHKRLVFCLNPLIPKIIKKCKGMYPKSMAVNPGFMYEASEEYGDGKHLWVNPDVPLYFDQDEVMDILYKHKALFLPAIDRAVKKYVNQTIRITEDKVVYAQKLSSLKEQTYFELLKKYPFWYEMLYNELYNQKEKL